MREVSAFCHAACCNNMPSHRRAHLSLLAAVGILLLAAGRVTGESQRLERDVERAARSGDPIYLNEYAIHAKGGEHRIRRLVEEHGFLFKGQVGSLADHYMIEAPDHHVRKRSVEPDVHYHSALAEHEQVEWVEQQVGKRRVKRDYESMIPLPSPYVDHPVGYDPHVSDPLYDKQWFLNRGFRSGHGSPQQPSEYDMNVLTAWAMNYTGRDVVISILDDGIQYDHDDLSPNYDPRASTDINGNDDDPYPTNDGNNKHGTRCAGEVSAMANNTVCGVGIAYDSKIGGVRMLDGTVNDIVEARALSLNPWHIDIYSASWGPEDNGGVVDGPGKLAKKAFVDGVAKVTNHIAKQVNTAPINIKRI